MAIPDFQTGSGCHLYSGKEVGRTYRETNRADIRGEPGRSASQKGHPYHNVAVLTGSARYVNRIEKKIVLSGGEQLAQLMIDHGIGVTEVVSYSVKKVDLDYFNDEL